MPNGGSDCCGTCQFNSKKNPSKGYQDDRKEAYCIIRDLEVPDPFWTYCANHQHHNLTGIMTPLGAVRVYAEYPEERKVWKMPPDTEEVRQKLIELTEGFDASFEVVFPLPTTLEKEVISQLEYFREVRAIPALMQFVQSNVDLYRVKGDYAAKDKVSLIGQAIEVILNLSKGEELPNLTPMLQLGLEFYEMGMEYDPETDGLAPIRYHLIRGLRFCPETQARPIAIQGLKDPHPDIQKFAGELIDKWDSN